MRALQLILFMGSLGINVQLWAQESNAELLKKAQVSLNEAVQAQDFEQAAKWKKEIEVRSKIEECIAKGDFETAAQLKKELEEKPTQALERTDKKEEGFNLSTTEIVSGFKGPAEGKAVVYFVCSEKSGFAVGFEYFHEKQFIGKFLGNGYLRFECEPGNHLFWASSENKEWLEADLEANKTYIIRITRSVGAWKPHVKYKVITRDNAKELKEVKKIVDKKPASHLPESELKAIHFKMNRFIEQEVFHFYNNVKGKKPVKKMNKTDNIPLEMW
jgi:hypothetical protein